MRRLIPILFAFFSTAAAATWPDDRPIEVVVGFAAGGGTDVMARTMLPYIQKHLGGKANMIVLNKPGAASEISNMYLARAKPDGYTVGIVNVPALIFVPMYKKAQYNLDQINLIARVLSDPTVIVVKKTSPYTDLKQIVAALKEKPGSLSFGHNGVGTNGHLGLLQLQNAAHVTLNDIPFNGTAPSRTALMGGHIDAAVMTTGELPDKDNEARAFRIIAQMSPSRHKALKDVPTAIEQGFDVVMPAERGFAAPQGLPAAIGTRLQAAIEATLRDPEYLAKASNDAPVLAYLAGQAWRVEIDKRKRQYEALVKMIPKE